jgi:Xaa-Pro dipeptidase
MPEVADYPRFSPAEFERRRAATDALMERNGCEVIIFFGSSAQAGTGQADIYYLSHHMGRQENFVVWFAGQEPVLLVEAYNHVPNALRQSVIADTRHGGPKVAFGATLLDLLKERKSSPTRVGIVGWLPYQVYSPLADGLPGVELVDLTRDFRHLRLHKSDEELEWLRLGAQRTDAAMVSMMEGMRPGIREFELAFLLSDGYRVEGGEDYLHYISSTPQGAPDRCCPAQTPSNRTLAKGDIVSIELSIGYHGYAGQALRTMIIDDEPNDLFSDLYEVAELAYEGMCGAIKPGSTTEVVLTAAEVIDDRGYHIVDGLLHGYGIGLLPPSIPGDGNPTTLTRPVRLEGASQRPFVFEEGMTVVVQPNVVTADGSAGVQLGNLVLVTPDGVEPMHDCPFEFVRTSS